MGELVSVLRHREEPPKENRVIWDDRSQTKTIRIVCLNTPEISWFRTPYLVCVMYAGAT